MVTTSVFVTDRSALVPTVLSSWAVLFAVFGSVVLLVTSTWLVCFLFNDAATTEIYTLSLHVALPILVPRLQLKFWPVVVAQVPWDGVVVPRVRPLGHTSVRQTPAALDWPPVLTGMR